MNTTLTLSLNKDVIELAKRYAKEKNVSLSSLIENYLRKIVSDFPSPTQKQGSIVNELSGIISLDPDVDEGKEYADYLVERYS